MKVEFTFDPTTYRHSMNGHQSVLHCHHYMALTTKLAMDMADIGGPQILMETTEDSIRPLFDSYFTENGVSSPDERLKVGEEYYAIMGMGRLEVTGNESGGDAVLMRSHVDEGWLKKWGKHDAHINHFTCGYLAALFGAVFNRPPRSFRVTETESPAMGASEGKFKIESA